MSFYAKPLRSVHQFVVALPVLSDMDEELQIWHNEVT